MNEFHTPKEKTMDYPVELFRFGEAKTIRNSGEEGHARAQGFTEPYKFQEYPKHLYKDGTRETHAVSGNQVGGEERVVKNLEEEKVARAAGFRMLGDPAPEPQEPAEEEEPAEAQPKAKKSK